MSELIERAGEPGDNPAIVDSAGVHTYDDLVASARSVAVLLQHERGLVAGERVATMVTPSFEYVAVQWGIWLAGGIAVPLALTHPDAELEYVIGDSAATAVVAGPEHRDRMASLVAAEALLASEELLHEPSTAELSPQQTEDAMLLYTSGTTGRAKGVVWRHEAIAAQAKIMSDAWGWQPNDRALLVLPLHHVHGLINVVTTALWNGACVEMLPRFEPAPTLERLLRGETSVFMAVPAIYRRLIAEWEALDTDDRIAARAPLERMRLMVSGSAALPVPTLERWREISGHVLLERYGMTEIGMALSNSYEGQRIPGAVGRPLPTVQARVVDETDSPVPTGTQGQLQIRGPSVFDRYWQRPEATANSFVDGWFRTGDIVTVDDKGVYRILGRASVDIIKTGGEKVSALEIEDVLRRHAGIDDCAVVGVADDEWGELVVAAITTAPGAPAPDLGELRDFCRDKLAPAKIPRRLKVVEDLPRNALGKVVKAEVKALFADVSHRRDEM